MIRRWLHGELPLLVVVVYLPRTQILVVGGYPATTLMGRRASHVLLCLSGFLGITCDFDRELPKGLKAHAFSLFATPHLLSQWPHLITGINRR
jgi:hypothetical protein